MATGTDVELDSEADSESDPQADTEADGLSEESIGGAGNGPGRGLAVALVLALWLVVLVVLAAVYGADQTSVHKRTALAAATTTPRATVAPPTTSVSPGPPPVVPVASGRSIVGPTPCPKTDGSETRASTFAAAPPLCIDPAKRYTAVFTTSAGEIDVALDVTNTPKTVNSFVVLARYKYYDLSALFRTDPGIDIIQGGAPSTQSVQDPGPGYTIADEPQMTTLDPTTNRRKGPYHYTAGDLAMANTGDPDSAGSSFFFVTGPAAAQLDTYGTFVTFGKVTKGLDVLQQIQASNVECSPAVRTCLGGGPDPAVVITSLTIQES